MAKTALITGITGQDGYWLSKLLLEKGYNVYGIIRGQNNPKAQTVKELLPAVHLREADLRDFSSLTEVIEETQPDEVYNLAAISFVGLSWKQPELTADITGLGCLRMLEAMRLVGGPNHKMRFYQASSSEMFGKVRGVPQNEDTPFYPRSPYGSAKAFAHYTTVNHRESYGTFACSGILFNHESERFRGLEFVTRKITNGVARIAAGLQDELVLGSLHPRRDWSHAKDMVYGMWLMLQQDEPDDYVLASGETHSIEEFLDKAFIAAGVTSESGAWSEYVRQDPRFMRPAEVDLLVGDYSKAKEKLGWEPKISFDQLVQRMVDYDYHQVFSKLAQ